MEWISAKNNKPPHGVLGCSCDVRVKVNDIVIEDVCYWHGYDSAWFSMTPPFLEGERYREIKNVTHYQIIPETN